MSRPNILMIMADQMTALALPMYGHNVVKTPHLERIAEHGTTFLNAYCNNPVCAPSRFSMMTGRLSSRVQAYDNAAEFMSSYPTYAHYLRGLGYRTCLSGKMHFVGADQLHGYEERLTTDIYPSDFGWTPDWSRTDTPFAPSVMSLRGVVEAGVCKRSLQIDYDDEVCFHASRWLYDYVRGPQDAPFLLTASFTHPHNPFTITQRYWDYYRDDDIDLPAVPAIPPERRDPWSRRHYYLIRQDEHAVSERTLRTARHAYYGMISYVDDQVGRLLDILDDTGLADNTIVLFTADHGEMLGERGMWFKFNPYEWSVRVPLLLRVPGGAKGRVETKGVSLLDLLPTFVEAADADTPGEPFTPIDPLDGVSLLAMAHGDDPSRRDEVPMEFTGEGVYSPCLMLRRDGYKYIYCDDDPPLLFDLNRDPLELNNLANDPNHAATARQLADAIGDRWDAARLKADIVASQRRRLYVQQTLLEGQRHPWDFQPKRDASTQYVRSAKDTNTTLTKGLARYPYVAPFPPDTPREG